VADFTGFGHGSRVAPCTESRDDGEEAVMVYTRVLPATKDEPAAHMP
jgi:hypothetical protein